MCAPTKLVSTRAGLCEICRAVESPHTPFSAALRSNRTHKVSLAFFAATALLLLTLFLTSCASDGNYRPLPPGEGPAVAPRFVELSDEPTISTIHFPRGTYSLEAEDDNGFYYRAPRQLTKHAFAGLQPYDGGIYVGRADRTRLRGYVVWAGGRTKVGNLSQAHYEFRD